MWLHLDINSMKVYLGNVQEKCESSLSLIRPTAFYHINNYATINYLKIQSVNYSSSPYLLVELII